MNKTIIFVLVAIVIGTGAFMLGIAAADNGSWESWSTRAPSS